MIDLTKTEMCSYLARNDLPLQPAFEFRKLPRLEGVNPQMFEFVKKAFCRTHYDYFDPPHPYLNYQNIKGVSAINSVPERLSQDDENLLQQIFNSDSLENIVESEETFDSHYLIFKEFKDKPNWDLLRISVSDQLSNYLQRQRNYENLLNGGLNEKINSGEIIQLDDNRFKFSDDSRLKKKDIIRDSALHDINSASANINDSGFINLNDTLYYLAESIRVHGIYEDSSTYKFSEAARVFRAALQNNPDSRPKWVESPIEYLLGNFVGYDLHSHLALDDRVQEYIRKTPVIKDDVHNEGMEILLHTQQWYEWDKQELKAAHWNEQAYINQCEIESIEAKSEGIAFRMYDQDKQKYPLNLLNRPFEIGFYLSKLIPFLDGEKIKYPLYLKQQVENVTNAGMGSQEATDPTNEKPWLIPAPKDPQPKGFQDWYTPYAPT